MRNVQTPVLIAAASIAITVIISVIFYKRNKRNNPPTEWKPVGKVTKLHLYPLKSGRRIELTSADVTKYGIRQNKNEEKDLKLRDRSFIVYGEKNKEFKTARTFPKMVLIEVSVHNESHVAFDAPGMESLYVKLPNIETTEANIVNVTDGEQYFTLDCGDEAASWISRYLYGKPSAARIGYHDALSEHQRSITKHHKKLSDIYEHLGDQSVGLYSGITSFLLVNQASVDDLNRRINSETTITAEHFRPGITIAGEDAPAYCEENWDWIKIGDAIFRNVKPCTRCIMTIINPETGIRNKDREPLKTLETSVAKILPWICYILVVSYCFSKVCLTFIIRRAAAGAVIKHFENGVILMFGVPRTILCDNGVKYKSRKFTRLMEKFGVDVLHNPVYHPKANPAELTESLKQCWLRMYRRISESGMMNYPRYRRLKDLKNIDFEGKSPVMGIHLDVNACGIIKIDDTVYVG